MFIDCPCFTKVFVGNVETWGMPFRLILFCFACLEVRWHVFRNFVGIFIRHLLLVVVLGCVCVCFVSFLTCSFREFENIRTVG